MAGLQSENISIASTRLPGQSTADKDVCVFCLRRATPSAGDPHAPLFPFFSLVDCRHYACQPCALVHCDNAGRVIFCPTCNCVSRLAQSGRRRTRSAAAAASEAEAADRVAIDDGVSSTRSRRTSTVTPQRSALKGKSGAAKRRASSVQFPANPTTSVISLDAASDATSVGLGEAAAISAAPGGSGEDATSVPRAPSPLTQDAVDAIPLDPVEARRQRLREQQLRRAADAAAQAQKSVSLFSITAAPPQPRVSPPPPAATATDPAKRAKERSRSQPAPKLPNTILEPKQEFPVPPPLVLHTVDSEANTNPLTAEVPSATPAPPLQQPQAEVTVVGAESSVPTAPLQLEQQPQQREQPESEVAAPAAEGAGDVRDSAAPADDAADAMAPRQLLDDCEVTEAEERDVVREVEAHARALLTQRMEEEDTAIHARRGLELEFESTPASLSVSHEQRQLVQPTPTHAPGQRSHNATTSLGDFSDQVSVTSEDELSQRASAYKSAVGSASTSRHRRRTMSGTAGSPDCDSEARQHRSTAPEDEKPTAAAAASAPAADDTATKSTDNTLSPMTGSRPARLSSAVAAPHQERDAAAELEEDRRQQQQLLHDAVEAEVAARAEAEEAEASARAQAVAQAEAVASAMAAAAALRSAAEAVAREEAAVAAAALRAAAEAEAAQFAAAAKAQAAAEVEAAKLAAHAQEAARAEAEAARTAAEEKALAAKADADAAARAAAAVDAQTRAEAEAMRAAAEAEAKRTAAEAAAPQAAAEASAIAAELELARERQRLAAQEEAEAGERRRLRQLEQDAHDRQQHADRDAFAQAALQERESLARGALVEAEAAVRDHYERSAAEWLTATFPAELAAKRQARAAAELVQRHADQRAATCAEEATGRGDVGQEEANAWAWLLSGARVDRVLAATEESDRVQREYDEMRLARWQRQLQEEQLELVRGEARARASFREYEAATRGLLQSHHAVQCQALADAEERQTAEFFKKAAARKEASLRQRCQLERDELDADEVSGRTLLREVEREERRTAQLVFFQGVAALRRREALAEQAAIAAAAAAAQEEQDSSSMLSDAPTVIAAQARRRGAPQNAAVTELPVATAVAATQTTPELIEAEARDGDAQDARLAAAATPTPPPPLITAEQLAELRAREAAYAAELQAALDRLREAEGCVAEEAATRVRAERERQAAHAESERLLSEAEQRAEQRIRDARDAAEQLLQAQLSDLRDEAARRAEHAAVMQALAEEEQRAVLEAKLQAAQRQLAEAQQRAQEELRRAREEAAEMTAAEAARAAREAQRREEEWQERSRADHLLRLAQQESEKEEAVRRLADIEARAVEAVRLAHEEVARTSAEAQARLAEMEHRQQAREAEVQQAQQRVRSARESLREFDSRSHSSRHTTPSRSSAVVGAAAAAVPALPSQVGSGSLPLPLAYSGRGSPASARLSHSAASSRPGSANASVAAPFMTAAVQPASQSSAAPGGSAHASAQTPPLVPSSSRASSFAQRPPSAPVPAAAAAAADAPSSATPPRVVLGAQQQHQQETPLATPTSAGGVVGPLTSASAAAMRAHALPSSSASAAGGVAASLAAMDPADIIRAAIRSAVLEIVEAQRRGQALQDDAEAQAERSARRYQRRQGDRRRAARHVADLESSYAASEAGSRRGSRHHPLARAQQPDQPQQQQLASAARSSFPASPYGAQPPSRDRALEESPWGRESSFYPSSLSPGPGPRRRSPTGVPVGTATSVDLADGAGAVPGSVGSNALPSASSTYFDDPSYYGVAAAAAAAGTYRSTYDYYHRSSISARGAPQAQADAVPAPRYAPYSAASRMLFGPRGVPPHEEEDRQEWAGHAAADDAKGAYGGVDAAQAAGGVAHAYNEPEPRKPSSSVPPVMAYSPPPSRRSSTLAAGDGKEAQPPQQQQQSGRRDGAAPKDARACSLCSRSDTTSPCWRCGEMICRHCGLEPGSSRKLCCTAHHRAQLREFARRKTYASGSGVPAGATAPPAAAAVPQSTRAAAASQTVLLQQQQQQESRSQRRAEQQVQTSFPSSAAPSVVDHHDRRAGDDVDVASGVGRFDIGTSPPVDRPDATPPPPSLIPPSAYRAPARVPAALFAGVPEAAVPHPQPQQQRQQGPLPERYGSAYPAYPLTAGAAPYPYAYPFAPQPQQLPQPQLRQTAAAPYYLSEDGVPLHVADAFVTTYPVQQPVAPHQQPMPFSYSVRAAVAGAAGSAVAPSAVPPYPSSYMHAAPAPAEPTHAFDQPYYAQYVPQPEQQQQQQQQQQQPQRPAPSQPAGLTQSPPPAPPAPVQPVAARDSAGTRTTSSHGAATAAPDSAPASAVQHQQQEEHEEQEEQRTPEAQRQRQPTSATAAAPLPPPLPAAPAAGTAALAPAAEGEAAAAGIAREAAVTSASPEAPAEAVAAKPATSTPDAADGADAAAAASPPAAATAGATAGGVANAEEPKTERKKTFPAFFVALGEGGNDSGEPRRPKPPTPRNFVPSLLMPPAPAAAAPLAPRKASQSQQPPPQRSGSRGWRLSAVPLRQGRANAAAARGPVQSPYKPARPNSRGRGGNKDAQRRPSRATAAAGTRHAPRPSGPSGHLNGHAEAQPATSVSAMTRSIKSYIKSLSPTLVVDAAGNEVVYEDVRKAEELAHDRWRQQREQEAEEGQQRRRLQPWGAASLGAPAPVRDVYLEHGNRGGKAEVAKDAAAAQASHASKLGRYYVTPVAPYQDELPPPLPRQPHQQPQPQPARLARDEPAASTHFYHPYSGSSAVTSETVSQTHRYGPAQPAHIALIPPVGERRVPTLAELDRRLQQLRLEDEHEATQHQRRQARFMQPPSSNQENYAHHHPQQQQQQQHYAHVHIDHPASVQLSSQPVPRRHGSGGRARPPQQRTVSPPWRTELNSSPVRPRWDISQPHSAVYQPPAPATTAE